MSLTAVELVLKYYRFPFVPHQFQADVVNQTAHLKRFAHFLDIGCGKTMTSTMSALYAGLSGRSDQIMVIVPPILLRQWKEWLELIGLSVTVYAGTPAKRKGLDLTADAVVLTYGILKNDFKILTEIFESKKVFIIIDECAAIRNPGSQTFKAVRDITQLPLTRCCMLSGTPIAKPWHAYGIIKIKSPEVYRDWRQFQVIHVTSVDQFDEPRGYVNLDLLASNLMLHAVRVRAEDVLELPDIVYQPVLYDLEPKHLRLYNRIVEEQLVALDDDKVIDGTTQQRLYHTLQRLILMPALYGGDKIKPTGFSLIDTVAQEAGIFSGDTGKLTVFVNYQESNENVDAYAKGVKGLNPIQAFGKLGARKNLNNIDVFLHNPDVNVLIAHPGSIGIGINLQSVCATALFLELPLTSDTFQQALGRFYRQGQKRKCLIKFGIAAGTIQVELSKRIMDKEATLQRILPTKQTLRRALLGE